MQQRGDIKEYFNFLFSKFIPSIIIELGTGDGEFISMLRKEGDFVIHTFDNIDRVIDKVDGIIYHFINILWTENEHIVVELLKSGRVLLLCDDGNKPQEVNTFAKYLKTDDVIMAHDYGDDLESFKKNQYWTDCEITYKDVEESLKDFKPFYQDRMIKAGWMSFKRK